MNQRRRLAKLTSAMCMLLLSSVIAQKAAYAAPSFSNFAFGSGVPFGGNTVLAGVGVTLSTTNTAPFGPASFLNSGSPAQVQFTFSAPISEFHLDVSSVRADESLTGFSIGNPTSLSGTLVNQAGLITTSLPFPNDSGSGRLSWVGINTTSITFTIQSLTGSALAVDQFGLAPLDSDGDGVPDSEDNCPHSDLSPTVVIGGCDSGVDNDLFVDDGGFGNGCTTSDLIAACGEDVSNHGKFVSCVAHLTNDLKRAGAITGQQKGKIQSCAAQADIP
jgi:hypothetical protein